MRAMSARNLAPVCLALLIGTLLSPTAKAGGFGVYDSTAFHFGEALSEGGGNGTWLDQGVGLELFLGHRTSRLTGRLRFAYNAVVDLDPRNTDRETAERVQHTGLFAVGARVELLPDLEKVFGLYASLDFGVSPLVTNLRIFVFGQVGPGIRIRPVEALEIFAEVGALLRYEHAVGVGPSVQIGARVSFD